MKILNLALSAILLTAMSSEAARPGVSPLTVSAFNNLSVTADSARIMLRSRVDANQSLPELPRRKPARANTTEPARVSLSGAAIQTWMAPTSDMTGGWFDFQTNGTFTAKWTNILSQYGINITSGWVRNNKLCGLASMGSGGLVFYYNYVECDLTTGELLAEEGIGADNTIDMSTYYVSCAYVESEDRIYGFTHNEDETGYRFTSSPASKIGDVKVIKNLDDSGNRANALCYNEIDDSFYGVTFYGDFVRIDKQGNTEVIFNLNLDNLKNDKMALLYSPLDGCFIFTPLYYDYCSQLIYIYPESKQTRFVKNFPTDNQFTFMLSDSFKYTPAAPAAAKLTTSNFGNGALSGELIYTLPSTAGNGDALSGSLDWTLYVDNVSVETGSGSAGSPVTVTINDLTEGEHVVRMSCANRAGAGVPCVFTRYFGHGIPLQPENVVMTETSVSWDAVTESILDGWLEPGKMRYDVYLDNKFIGSTDATSMSITLDPATQYAAHYCQVAANCNDHKSERTTSNKVLFGAPLTLPYLITPTAAQAELTQVFNLDGGPAYGIWDFSEARWHEPVFYSGYNVKDTCDDWLVLPPVDCSDLTHSYRVTLDAICGGMTGKDERFEVWCGPTANPSDMTTLIIPETQVTDFITEGWQTFSNLFVPKSAGACYIAIRSVSPPEQYSLIIRKIRIEATDEPADVPAAPEGFAVTASSDAELTATVKLTMPLATISNTPIAMDADLKVAVGIEGKMVEQAARPGETVTLTVPTNQGNNRLQAYCILNGQAGQTTTVNIFTGTIPPNFVENLKLSISEDNMTMHLTWEPPLGGQENLTGYYSPEGMHYYVMKLDRDDETGESDWVEAKKLDNVLEYDFTLPKGALQRIQYIGIAAANNGGRSDAIWYVFKNIGTPYAAPISENFDLGTEPGLHYTPLRFPTPSEEYNGTWGVAYPEEVVNESWNPEIPYALVGYTDNEAGGKARLELPKFATTGLETPALTLKLWTKAPCGTVSIYASSFDKPAFTKIHDVPAYNAGWKDVEITLPEAYRNKQWVHLAVDTYLDGYYTYTLLGGYSFGEATGAGISETHASGGGNVFGGHGEITVTGMTGASLDVYSVDGKRMARVDRLDGDLSVKVTPGVYTAVCNGQTYKLFVR